MQIHINECFYINKIPLYLEQITKDSGAYNLWNLLFGCKIEKKKSFDQIKSSLEKVSGEKVEILSITQQSSPTKGRKLVLKSIIRWILAKWEEDAEISFSELNELLIGQGQNTFDSVEQVEAFIQNQCPPFK